MTDQPNATPGTAGLYDMVKALRLQLEVTQAELEAERSQHREMGERRRAVLLCQVDEYERDLGYGSDGRPPRTSEIRQVWRELGQPSPRRKKDEGNAA